MDSMYGPPCPFRSAGYTWKAGFYPLSPSGLSIIAEHNGVPPEKLPRGARNSSGPGMHRWIEELGRRKSAGMPTRHSSGRWLSPSELGIGPSPISV